MAATSLTVLLVLHGFLPTSIAGTELHAFHLARHLSQGHKVAVFHPIRQPGSPPGELRNGKVHGVQTFEVVQNHDRRPLELLSDAVIDQSFSQVLAEFSPDIVHFHHLGNLSLRLPAIAKAAGIKTVMTLHDYNLICPSGGQMVAHPTISLCTAPSASNCAACYAGYRQQRGGLESLALRLAQHSLGPLSAGWPFKLFQKLPASIQGSIRLLNRPSPKQVPESSEVSADYFKQVAQAFSSLDRILSPSRDLIGRFRSAGFNHRHFYHLANGVPDPWARPNIHQHPAPSQPPKGKVRLIHIGTLVEHKGIDLIIEASRNLDSTQVCIDIYGRTDLYPSYLRPLQKLAAQDTLLQFKGPCKPEEVMAILANSHGMILAPRWPENAPLSVLEAQAAGRPIIAPRIGGLPEMIEDGVNGLLYDPGSASALTRALKRFVDNNKERDNLIAGVKMPPTSAMQAQQLLTHHYGQL